MGIQPRRPLLSLSGPARGSHPPQILPTFVVTKLEGDEFLLTELCLAPSTAPVRPSFIHLLPETAALLSKRSHSLLSSDLWRTQ